MISRQWRGVAKPQHADSYVKHLREETFPKLLKIAGFVSGIILRRNIEDGVEFLIVTNWRSMNAIEEFAGPNSEFAVVPETVQKMMSAYDRHVRHYEVFDEVVSQRKY